MSAWSRPILALATLLVVGCELFEPASPPGGSGGQRLPRLAYQKPLPFPFLAVPTSTDGQRLYAETIDGDLVAVSMATGDVAWYIPWSEEYWSGHPVVADGLVLAATDRARAYEAATGVERWSIPLPSSAIHHVSATANGVWYLGVGNEVWALDVQTGAERWRQTFAGTDPYAARARTLAVAGDGVYVCGEQVLEANGARTQGPVVAMDAATGAVRWRHIMRFAEEYNYCVDAPLVTADAVVLADYASNNIVALERASGAPRWHFRGEFGWYGSRATPVLRGDTVYVASADKNVRALSLQTGTVIWETEFDGSFRHVANCGAVLLANNLSLHVIDPRTGAVLARDIAAHWPLGHIPSTPPVVIGDSAWMLGWENVVKLVCPRVDPV